MTVIIFIAVLVVLILVHEFGHFLFAKIFNVKVEEFGIGYPPRAAKLAKIGDTEYTLNWLPFGGFVKLLGENREEDLAEEDKKRSLDNKKPWQKIIILLAGAFFNFLLAWILFSIVFFSGIPLFWDKNYVENSDLIINKIVSDSPAFVSGLENGDIIKDIYLKGDPNVKPRLLSPDFVAAFISEHPGEVLRLSFTSSEDKKIKTVEIIPAQGVLKERPSQAAIGVSMTLVAKKKFGILSSVYLGLKSSIEVVKDVFRGLVNLFYGIVIGQADLKHVAGPVGIASMVGEAASVGFIYLLYFMALISANLAVINLLPIPALDGGRIVFALYEWVFGSKAPSWLENGLNFIGFAALIILMLIVTYNDIAKLLS